MMTKKVSEEELRKLVNEVLDEPSLEAYVPSAKMTQVNAVVDPQAAETDPTNPRFKPQNKVELGVAVRNLTANMDDSTAPKVFDALKQAVAPDKEADAEEQKDIQMSKPEAAKDVQGSGGAKPTTGTKSGTKSEAVVREMVRKAIREQYQDYDAAVSGGTDDDDDEEPKKEAPPEPMSFEQLAKEIGLKVSGAKQFVDKALARMKFINQEYESNVGQSEGYNLNDMEILVLQAYRDYMDLLQSTGELSSADRKFLEDHADAAFKNVFDLEGFREFLHTYIRQSMTTPDFEGPYQKAEKFKGDYDWMEPGEDDYERVKRSAANHLARSLDEPHMQDYMNKYAPEEE